MSELNDWFQRQAQREERAVFLEEALLGNRFWAYAWYRLRYFFARYVVASLTHALTVLLLYRFFDESEFVAVLVAYAGASIVSSFWWGALEGMRAEVRRLYRRRSPHLIPKTVGRWLSFSLQLTLLAVVGTLLVVVLVAVDGTLGPADLYVVAILLGLSLQFFTRAYHSGIYAIRRIYRPLPAIIGVEVIGLTVALVLVPALGVWALPIGALTAVLTVTGLSLYFTSRAYWFLGLSPRPFVSWRSKRLVPRTALHDVFGGGFSYALASLDSLLVLVLYSTSPSSAAETGLFALFFLLAPTVRACAEWAQLMYFDYKKLEVQVFRNLRRRFERDVTRLAVVLGLAFAGIAVGVGAIVYRGSIEGLAWALVPFFVAVSLLAAVQMAAFAKRAYFTLAANAGACLIGYVAVGIAVDDELTTVLLLAGVSFAGFLTLRLRSERFESGSEALPWPTEWLSSLRRLESPVCVAAGRVYVDPTGVPDDDEWRHRQVAERLRRTLRSTGRVTQIEPGVLAWYERVADQPTLTEQSLPSFGGGLVQWLGARAGENGLTALRSAAAAGLLGGDLAREAVRLARTPMDVWELRTAFESMFTSGIVFAPDEPVPQSLRRLSSDEKRAVLLDAIAFARELRVARPRSSFQVTAFCPAGELQLIFLVSRRAPRRLCRRWSALIRRANLEAALCAPASPADSGADPRSRRRAARRLAARASTATQTSP
jgi:hypothetical protein